MAASPYVKPLIFAGVALVGLLFVWKGTAKASPISPKPQCGPGEVYDDAQKKCIKSATPPPPVDPTCVDGIKVADFAPSDMDSVSKRASVIRWAQERLVVAGFLASGMGAVDGKFGPNTKAALIAFQAAKGVGNPAGCVDANTWNALDQYKPGTGGGVAFGQEITDINLKDWATVKLADGRWKATCKEPADYEAAYGVGDAVVYGPVGGDYGTIINAVDDYARQYALDVADYNS